MDRQRKSRTARLAHELGRALFVLILATTGAHAATATRGVGPDLLSKYNLDSGFFSCFSGGPSFPAARVNDNYCDCVDGSDEPGQSLPTSYSAIIVNLFASISKKLGRMISLKDRP